MKKLCLECEIPFTGRSDKKFCSDYCRNHYNNNLNRNANNYVKKVNGILRKNRRILVSLFLVGKSGISRNRLSWEGFDFRFTTRVCRSKRARTSYYCYEYGYIFMTDSDCLIIRENSSQNAGLEP